MKVLEDLKKRRNLDIYGTIAVGLVCAALSLFDLIPEKKIFPIVLAVLSIMAFSLLATREVVLRDHRLVPTLAVYDDFHPRLVADRASSAEVLLIGVSLSRTIETSFVALKRSLESGAHVRIVLTSPTASDAALDARCQATRPEMDEIRSEIRSSISKLQALTVQTQGNLELRLTQVALKFGLNYLDVGKASETLHVQLYSFRLAGESRPIFILSRADFNWFECFRDQAEGIWDDAIPYDFRVKPNAVQQASASSAPE